MKPGLGVKVLKSTDNEGLSDKPGFNKAHEVNDNNGLNNSLTYKPNLINLI